MNAWKGVYPDATFSFNPPVSQHRDTTSVNPAALKLVGTLLDPNVKVLLRESKKEIERSREGGREGDSRTERARERGLTEDAPAVIVYYLQ